MPAIEVDALLFDEANEDKPWGHGISPRRLNQVSDNPFTVSRNRGDRAAPYVLYGLDHQGQCLAVPIMPTYEPGLWRPVTAWFCEAGEWQLLPA